MDKLEIEIVTVQGIEVAPQASSGQHGHHHHHERSHSRPTTGPTGARQRPKVCFITFKREIFATQDNSETFRGSSPLLSRTKKFEKFGLA